MKTYALTDPIRELAGATGEDCVAQGVRLFGSFVPMVIPEDAGAKTIIAKQLSWVLLPNDTSSAVIVFTGWDVWGSNSNWDLFDRYRLSHGESRQLIDTPVHAFSGIDRPAFVSILSLCLYFLWDVHVATASGDVMILANHDEFIRIFAADPSTADAIIETLDENGCDRLAKRTDQAPK